jgi:trehalose 6-phosphate phosphatase
MKDILTAAHQSVLSQIGWSNVLLAFDFDGTLAPIVDDPAAAQMRPRTRNLLEKLARLYPCVVISGRAQEDVMRRVRGIGLAAVVGNHGLEPWQRTEVFAATAQSWVPSLRRALGVVEGVVIEDKLFSLAVHYRRAPRKKQARAAILRCTQDLEGVRIIGGKDVINLIPRGAPHKGTALERQRERNGCDTALYVGDDETDEDVFALDDPGRLLTIRVGRKATSRAPFYLRNQASIDRLLSALVILGCARPARAAVSG